MIGSVARVFRIVLALAATAVLSAGAADRAASAGPRVRAPASDSAVTSPLDRGAALDHFLQGRLLDERGLEAEAMEEYRQALLVDPGQPAIEARASEVSAKLGEADRSLEYARLSLAHRPGDAHALWLEGGALFNLGRLPEALASLRAALAVDSLGLEYWKTLAHVAEQMDQVQLVDSCWRHAVELDEDDGESWFQLAAAEARLGRFAAADSMLEEAIAINPVRPGALFLEGWIQESLGNTDRAIDLYRQHLANHPGDQATRRRLIRLLVGAGRLSQASREAGVLEQASPDDPDVLEIAADLALRLGRTARAGELLDHLEELNAGDPALTARAVTVLAHRGHSRESLARARGWAGRHPGDYRGSLLVAQALSQSGDGQGAVAAARQAVALAPDSLGPRFALGGLLQARRNYAAAESVWSSITRRSPGNVRTQLDLAYCREQLGNVEGALDAVRGALASEPDNASALNFLGYLYADHNRNLPEAESLVQRALAQDPDNGAYLDSMGWVYFRLGRLPEARHELERAVELTHGDPIVREHLGDVYKGLRLFDLARDQYRQSLDRDQGNARVRAKLSGIR